jgi:hypothetical protein
MADKPTYVVHFRHGPPREPSIETHPIVVTVQLTPEQKEAVRRITGKDVSKLDLTAIELNQVVDAVAFGHGSTVGASY